MDICMCGTQAGYPHKRCPFPYYGDDNERIAEWQAQRWRVEQETPIKTSDRKKYWTPYEMDGGILFLTFNVGPETWRALTIDLGDCTDEEEARFNEAYLWLCKVGQVSPSGVYGGPGRPFAHRPYAIAGKASRRWPGRYRVALKVSWGYDV